MQPGTRDQLHSTRGYRAWIDCIQRGVSSALRIGNVRFLVRKVMRMLHVPWPVLQRLPIEGEFTITVGRRQIVYHSSLYDAVGRQLFWGSSREYEPETVRAITSRLRGGFFFDVGANTGFFSLVAAGSDDRVICHAFEPSPPVFAALETNVFANGLAHQNHLPPDGGLQRNRLGPSSPPGPELEQREL